MHVIADFKDRFFRARDVVRFSILFISMCCHGIYLSGQNFYETEGRQKVQIFDDGTYRIVQENGIDFFSFSDLKQLPAMQKTLAQLNIIEAEYFVSLHTLQKEIDILETAYQKARKEGNKQELRAFKDKIKQLKERRKDISGLYDNALYFQKTAIRAAQSPEKIRTGNWQKLEDYLAGKDYVFKSSKYAHGDIQYWQNPLPGLTETQQIQRKNPSDTILREMPDKPIISNENCQFIREKSAGTETITHLAEPVFVFTPKRLKIHLKEENLIECFTQVGKRDKDVYLTFRMVIRSKDAAKSYGHIQEGSIVRLEFVNGIRLNLKASESVFGTFEEYSGKIIYQIKFKLDKEMVKQLQNIPLDYLGIMWTSGYEKYEIFEVDVIMRQLTCIKSLKNI